MKKLLGLLLILIFVLGCGKREEEPKEDWALTEMKKAQEAVEDKKVVENPNEIEVSYVQGDVVLISRANQTETVAKKGAVLTEKTEIKTRSRSQIDIQNKSKKFKSRIKEEGDAIGGSFAFLNDKPEGGLEIQKGTIYIELAKNEFKNLKIKTPSTQITVIGTAFCVEVYGDNGNTWVGVTEGEVEVLNLVTNQETHLFKGEAAELNALDGRTEVLYLTESEAEIMRQEIRRIGSGFPEELQPRVELLLPKNKERVETLFNSAAIASNGKEPLRIHRLLMGALKLMEDGVVEEEKDFLLASIKKLEEALLYYSDPDYAPQLLTFIGVYYRNLKEYEKAVNAFDAVTRLYPDSQWASLAYTAMGMVLEKDLNEWEKADAVYETVIEKYPDSLEVEAAADGLDRIRDRRYE